MIRQLVTPRFSYPSELDQQRATGLQRLTLALLALILVLLPLLLLNPAAGSPPGGILPSGMPVLIGVLAGLGVGLVAVYALLQRGQLRWASFLLVGLFTLGALALITTYEFGPVYLIVPLIAAAVLLGRGGLAVTALLLAGGLLLRYAAINELDTPMRVVPSRGIAAATLEAFILIGLMFTLLYLFGGATFALSRRSTHHARRLARLQQLTPVFAAETSEAGLINRVLAAAQDELGYALAQIYLVDAAGRITRRLRQGSTPDEVIATLTANAGETEVVTEAVQSRVPVMTGAHASAARAAHLVAPSRSALSAPVIFTSGRVSAVLDGQSVSPAAADSGEQAALTALAQLFAAAWEKLTLTVDQARIITEQAAQLERLRVQVNSLEGRSRQTAVSGWEDYLRGRGEDRIGFDLIRQQQGLSERDLRPASDLPPDMRAVLERGEPLVTQEDGEQVINVPIRVRDAMLGAMAFRLPAGQVITQRQTETVRIVAERLGLALESTRLYEQTQSQARRERKASEVTSLLLGATDLNTLLNAAAGAFNEALGAVYTRVTVEPDALAQPAGRPLTNGSHNPASQGGN